MLAIASAARGKAEREVYYRNYGCAIERANYFNLTEDILWEAIEQYKKSFQICSGQLSVGRAAAQYAAFPRFPAGEAGPAHQRPAGRCTGWPRSRPQ